MLPQRLLPLSALKGLVKGRSTFVVSDPLVWRLHGRALRSITPFPAFLLPQGEKGKSLGQIEKLLESLVRQGLNRNGVLIAFGGGAVCDATGLASSLALRGVNHILIPTTLLSQVDAAIGGKTAVNLKAGKNLCGTFKWPLATLIHRPFLKTLPKKELQSGKGELLKISLIEGGPLWKRVHSGDPLQESILLAASRAKSGIVARDPYETKGVREVLNLGHTAGHALEHLTGEPHGLCVAQGLRVALELSRQLSVLKSPTLPAEVDAWLRRHGLPLRPRRVDVNKIMDLISRDKKKKGKMVQWLLVQGPGKMVMREIEDASLVRRVLSDILL